MAKHLNVSLGFTADTSQAAQAIKQLQQQLQQLISNPGGGKSNFKLTDEIQQATRAAAELQVHLQNATNKNTGNLDFGKFNQSIKAAGGSLDTYAQRLLSLGDNGKVAFNSLVRSVAQAEVPLKRTSGLLTQMGTTLKNSIRWQFSSSMIHGFMSSIQGAWNYARGLNESLTNIPVLL